MNARIYNRLRKSLHVSVLVLLAASIVSTASAQDEGLPLGSKFSMSGRAFQDASGNSMRLGDARGDKGTVVIFWSNNCPWVSKYEERLLSLVSEYKAQGLGFVLVNANDPVAFPEESAQASAKHGYGIPYLMDNGSELARAFGASRTPHVFILDSGDALVYTGAIDDSPGDPGNVKKLFLKDALDAVVGGAAVSVPETKSFGCMIKFQGAGGS